MSKSYSLFNRREIIFQPNLTRQRIPFNGPVSSEMLNLYYDQLVLDIARLSKNIELIESLLDEANNLTDSNLDSATPGYYVDNNLSMTIYGQKISYDDIAHNYVVQSSTPYYQYKLNFVSPAMNSSRISFLKSKLDYLEKKLS